MGQVIEASFAPKQTDGGKARIQRRRDVLMLDRMYGASTVGGASDLTMDHTDPGYPSDSPYFAPDSDPA